MNTLFRIIALMTAPVWTGPEFDFHPSPGVSVAVPECVLATEWVEANPDALPTTLESYSTYSSAYRRAIYEALDVEARISLWKEHLASVAHAITSPEQRLFLQAAPLGFYLGGNASESEVRAFEKEAIAILGEELTRAAFYSLGGPVPVQDGEGQFPDCSCRIPTELNPSPKDCVAGSVCLAKLIIFDVCRDTKSGCGFLDLFACSGLCYKTG